MINRTLTRISDYLVKRRRDRVIEGLLLSIYWQARTGTFEPRVDRKPGENPTDHALRALSANVQHQQAALATIGLMVRNELVARGLEDQMGDQAIGNPSASDAPIATLKRTIAEKPE